MQTISETQDYEGMISYIDVEGNWCMLSENEIGKDNSYMGGLNPFSISSPFSQGKWEEDNSYYGYKYEVLTYGKKNLNCTHT